MSDQTELAVQNVRITYSIGFSRAQSLRGKPTGVRVLLKDWKIAVDLGTVTILAEGEDLVIATALLIEGLEHDIAHVA